MSILSSSILCTALRHAGRALPLCMLLMHAPAPAQDVTSYEEQYKRIKSPNAATRLGPDLFGDSVNLYTGALAFTQVDVSIPGNNKLPVALGRRLQVEPGMLGGRAFGIWSLDIPHMHGIFPLKEGWQSRGPNRALRCAQYGDGPPPPVQGSLSSWWEADEYWHGNYLYVPGVGDQRLLRRTADSAALPGKPLAQYPAVTSQFWVFSCTPGLDNDTSAGRTEGDGFIALAPDGTRYTFNWMVDFPAKQLVKANETALTRAPAVAATAGAAASRTDAGAAPAAQALSSTGSAFRLARKEVWLLPTLVTDRFGNSVRYTYDPAYPRNLVSITSSESPPRIISLTWTAPDANGDMQVQTVSDGSRTWTYGYHKSAAPNTWRNLDSVTLPDGSAWNFAATDTLLPGKLPPAGCDSGNLTYLTPSTGVMMHPSGAAGSFSVTPTTHGRSDVPFICPAGDQGPPVPMYFNTYSLTNKTVSGSGFAAMAWNYDYGAPNASAQPCDGCVTNKIVTVTDPAGNASTHVFGNRHNVSEGRIEEVRVGARATATRYQPPAAGPYPDLIGYADDSSGDAEIAARILPANQRITTQQGATFSWTASAFDEFAHPRQIVRASSLNPGRTEWTAYDNNLALWVLGQTLSITETATGKVMVANTINPATALTESVSHFGHLDRSMQYNADGTLALQRDGLNHVTRFGDFMRGIPRSIVHPDSSTEAAEVNNDGSVASITDALGFKTLLRYDAAGRLKQITYPGQQGDPAWNDTTLTLQQIDAAEFDLPAGHWRHDVVTGNAWSRTYLDALMRPVYSWTHDSAGGASSLVRTAYDHDSRTVFSSYPRPQFDAQLGQGVRTSYDALGRVTQVEADSELGVLTTLTSYDDGFRKTVRDARGNTSSTAFHVFDTPSETAIARISAPEGLNVLINRDVFGKPVSISRSGNDAGATRSYVYDANERLCKTIEPETGATLQQIDDAGNVSWRATGLALTAATCDWASVPSSAKISFSYDAMNRLTTTSYGDGSPAIARSYFADGQARTVSSAGAVWTMNYNSRRLPTTAALAFEGQTYTIGTTYDANGHPLQLSYPDATNSIADRTVDYDPDALGRPRRVGSYANAIAYHANGAVAGFTYGNGVVRSLAQNLRGLPEQARDGVVLHDVYSYDANANVSAIRDQLGSGSSRSMVYDGLDRLTGASAPGIWGDAVYRYDVLDNIRSSTVGDRVSTYVYGSRNLLDSVQSTAAGFNFSYGYDQRGNLTSRNNQSFAFDLGNRLGAATNLDTYVYDGFGRRVKTTAVDGTVTISVYSLAGQLLYTRRTGGPNQPLSTQYVYLHQHQIAEVKK